MTAAARLPARVRFADSVRPRFGPDRGFLFDERTGRVYSLNDSGAFAAERLYGNQPPTAVLAAVIEAFETDATTAARDLARFIEHLFEEGLAVDEESAAAGPLRAPDG